MTRQIDHPIVRLLAEHYGNGILTRLAAKLVELAAIPEKIRQQSTLLEDAGPTRADKKLPTAVGISHVEAARGRLTHRVELNEHTVRRYQIVAPTEWNFHPQGVITRGLVNRKVDDEELFRKQADLFVQAVDPCVGYDLMLY